MIALPNSNRRLPLAVALSAAMTIAAATSLLPAALVFAFKPLTTILIFVHAWPRGTGQPRQRGWILIGLLLSLLGDVLLMWPRQGFLPGLVAFLLAHLSYIAAFSQPLRFVARIGPFVAYGVIAAAILSFLWPGVPAPLRLPVLAYVLCLACMAAQAAAWWRASRLGPGSTDVDLALSAALGGALFFVSDGLLAINKFSMPLPLSALWILLSYWLAQWFIASSLRAPDTSSTPG